MVEDVTLSQIDDQTYLKNQQYRRADRLNARTSLHVRFGKQDRNWFRFLLDTIPMRGGEAVLDIGCGAGRFWLENWALLPRNIHILLADLSAGMVGDARAALVDDERFAFLEADAQSIPLKSGSMDGILANHMLYHVPDIHLAVREFRRILTPGGWLCTATNGAGHMKELHDFIGMHLPDSYPLAKGSERFTLENALGYLSPVFETVEIHPFPNQLWVTETDALMEYLRSTWMMEAVPEEKMQKLENEIEGIIRSKGGFSISTLGGVILSR